MFLLALMLSAASSATGRNLNYISCGVSDAICSNTIEFSFGHQIAERWSIGGTASLNIKRLTKEMDHETLQHQINLSDTDLPIQRTQFREDLSEVYISVHYWTTDIYKGAALGFGAVVKDRSGPDIFCHAGYLLRIRNGLGCELGWTICLKETINNKTINANGLRINICYVF